jgi:MOSC domain-containing protein YiiM
MNSRLVALIARSPDRWPLAGDQLYVDFDLSITNAPAGTRLAIGDAVVELTAQPHTGCSKFVARFGHDALRFVNGPSHKALRLRGVYARVVEPGTIRRGDAVTKLDESG